MTGSVTMGILSWIGLDRLSCAVGWHTQIVRGTGCMGDGSDCLSCGAQTYGPMRGRVVMNLDAATVEEAREFWSRRR